MNTEEEKEYTEKLNMSDFVYKLSEYIRRPQQFDASQFPPKGYIWVEEIKKWLTLEDYDENYSDKYPFYKLKKN